MRFSPPTVQWTFALVALLGLAAAGCGSSCFVGFSNNGNGGLLISASNPAAACPLSQGMGTVMVSAAKSAPCETCTKASRVDHIFVELSGIALRESGASSTWRELAPQLAQEPLQIDLMDSAAQTQTLFTNDAVPAASYDQIRIEFAADSQVPESMDASECGKTRWNCIVAGDGHADALFFPDDSSELVIHSDQIVNDFLLVLPETKMNLRLTLQPQSFAISPLATGRQLRNTLVARAASTR
jgi:hypothetical protein